MTLSIYREYNGQVSEAKVNPLPISSILRNGGKAHFAYFSTSLSTTVMESTKGKIHMDLLISSGGSNIEICMNGNEQAMKVLEAIKGIILLNREKDEATRINTYLSVENKQDAKHPYYMPALYAKLDSKDGIIHYRISEKSPFYYPGNAYNRTSTLSIYYTSPDFYTWKSHEGKSYARNITTNIVIENINASREEIVLTLERACDEAEEASAKRLRRQLNLDNFDRSTKF